MQAEFFDGHMSGAPDAEPVIEDPNLPLMTDRAPRPRRIGGKVVLMADEPKQPNVRRGTMKPLSKPLPRPRRQKLPLDEQTAQPRPQAAARDAERYIRIRVRAEGDSLSVQDIKRVQGPLLTAEELHGDLAYEVTIGERRLASGAIPDAGVARAFPHPDPAPGQEGHNFVPALTHDFIVRVPGDAISMRVLPRLNIALYRIKKGPVPPAEGDAPLAQRFGNELREVARLRGIRVDDLPQQVRAEARRALR